MATDPPGQWLGPFVYPAMGPQFEIAHAAVLPPAINDPGGRGLDMQRILFMCRSGCANIDVDCCTQYQPISRAYLWNRDDPQSVEVLDFPVGQFGDLRYDVFCSGHNFRPDGSLQIIGGTDYDAFCDEFDICTSTPPCEQIFEEDLSAAVGHDFSYLLLTDVDPPQITSAPPLGRRRWYPNGFPLDDGDLIVLGHAGCPSPVLLCPGDTFPGQTYPYPEAISETYERYDWATNDIDPITQCRELPSGPNPCSVADPRLVAMGEYPRVHLLSTGELIHTNASMPDPGNPTEELPTTRYMDLQNPPCGPNDLRWEEQAPGTTTPSVHRDGGSSVHLVLWDDVLGQPYDVIYVLGGTTGQDSLQCGLEQQQGLGEAQAGAEKIVRPGTGVSWDDASVPDLPEPRKNLNTVILPTGELIAVGGVGGVDVDLTCFPRLEPLLYRPPELFPEAPGDPNQWIPMAPQEHERPYHSTAALMASGELISAGGATPGVSTHSAEIYYPWYFFGSSGFRVGEA